MILALLATLGAMVVAFVLYPVFTEAAATGPAVLDETALALSDLGDKKAMLYEAIQELDFEKDSGKISAAEHETLRNDYLAQVAVVIQKIDALAPTKVEAASEAKKPATKPATKPNTGAKNELECAGCGANNPKGSNFCLECGQAFALACTKCGESLPAKSRFCNACGDKVSA